jgi:hypothetical protein
VGILRNLEVRLAVEQLDITGRGCKSNAQPRLSVQHYPGAVFQGYYPGFLNTGLDQILRNAIDPHTG